MDINTIDLILEHGNEEAATNYLLQEVTKSNLPFPYRKLYAPSPREIFQRLKDYVPQFDTNRYRLYRYFPRFNLFLPPFYSGGPLVSVNTKADLEQIDLLPDLYSEDIRIRKSCSGKAGAWHLWTNPEKCRFLIERAVRLPRITYEELRRIIAMKEHLQFRPTWAKGILSILIRDLYKNERVSILDLSANYGEILFPAMALDCNYLGFNSEPLLNQTFEQIILELGDSRRHRIIHRRFEETEIDQKFDMIFTSIPLFDSEDEDQYHTVQEWIVEYLFRLLMKAWTYLNDDGFLALHLSDTKRFPVCEAMNLFIEQFLSNSSYEGVIGIVSDINKPGPVWIWRKVVDISKRHIWSPPINKRPFCYLYPELKDRIVISQFSGLGNEFHQDCINQKKAVSEIIRELIHQRPVLTRKMITSILSEAILLTFVKHHGFEDSIEMILKILQPWTPDIQKIQNEELEWS